MDSELMKWAVQIGGPMAGLFMIGGYFYRKDMRFYVAEMKTVSEEWKGQSAMLMTIVKENTAAFTQNAIVVQSLHSHIAEGERRAEQWKRLDR